MIFCKSTSTVATTITTTTNTSEFLNLIFQNGTFFQFSLSTLTTDQVVALLSDGYDIADCIVNCSNKGICLPNSFRRMDPIKARITTIFNCLKGLCKFSSNKTFVCACSENYVGRVCSVDTRPCMYSPCANNGTCVEFNVTAQNSSSSSSVSYSCECGEYYYGSNCQHQVDLCENVTCLNGGYCLIQMQANCTCVNGYTGEKCETESASLKTIKQVSTVAGRLAPVFVFVGIYLMMAFFDLVTLLDQSRRVKVRKLKRIVRPVYRA